MRALVRALSFLYRRRVEENMSFKSLREDVEWKIRYNMFRLKSAGVTEM